MAPRLNAFYREAMEIMTDGFSEENCIGRFQFGKLYRGVGEYSNYTIKLFDKVDNYEVWPADNEARVQDEYCLAHDDYVVSHPNIVEFKATSMPSERPTVIYQIEAKDIVHNLIDKDSFSWLHRVKVAYGLALVVSHMHDCRPIPYIIRNISAAHILLDQEYNPKLYDFSMISGGSLADKKELLNQYVHGCHGYVDPDYICNGKWSEKCDVFAYGVVLISLLSKKVVVDEARKTNPEPFLYEWAYTKLQNITFGKQFESCEFCLVHGSLEAEAIFSVNDGVTLTKLAMQCVDYDPLKRPTMKQVVRRLRKLSIMQNHADVFGFGNVVTASNFNISGIGKLMTKKLRFILRMERNNLKAVVKKLIGNDNNRLTKKGLHFRPPIILSYEDLKQFTDGFSDENYIDVHQFGKLYHGKVGSWAVTVKTWEDATTCLIWEGDNESRMRDELVLLQHPKFISHPDIAKMIGYCYEDGRLGIVYDLESLDCLVNLIEEDSFTWRRRISFALKLAGLLKYLQISEPPYTPYVLRNLFPNNILVDKDYNPKLFNFGRLTGGILNDKEHSFIWRNHGWMYYFDPYTNCCEYYTKVSDIYSFGMVLLNLITKKTDFDGCDYDHQWAYEEYDRAASKGGCGLKYFSLADKSFNGESDFEFIEGHRVSKLAMRCIHRDYLKRPTSGQVVRYLQKFVKQ